MVALLENQRELHTHIAGPGSRRQVAENICLIGMSHMQYILLCNFGFPASAQKVTQGTTSNEGLSLEAR